MEIDYKRNLPRYEQLQNEARYVLEKTLSSSQIKIHSITSRVKELESIRGKSERLNLESPLEELSDIVGIRVVCLLRSDIQKIIEIVSATFTVLTEDNKILNADVSTFGYQSVHFIAKLKSEYSGPRYDGIKELKFEIQIRTIAMDAWAAVSHYVDYKAEHDIPEELKKDFHALSGLFYLADTHFEIFYNAGQTSKKDALNNTSDEINLDTLRAFLSTKFSERVGETEANLPKIFKVMLTETISDLVGELTAAGYTTISQLDDAIDFGWDTFLLYEEENPPGDYNKKLQNKGNMYAPSGVVRCLLSIVDENFIKQREGSHERENYEKYRNMLPHRKK